MTSTQQADGRNFQYVQPQLNQEHMAYWHSDSYTIG